MTSLKLDVDCIRSFRIAKLFRDHQQTTSMDISRAGDCMISCCTEEDQINIYDLNAGVLQSTIYSKKYGIDILAFSQGKKMAIHNSTKIDDAVRYLALEENKYERYFSGHTKKVTSIKVGRSEDEFMTASEDGSVRMWDVRSPNTAGILHYPGGSNIVTSYDPAFFIFVVGVGSDTMMWYDLRTFDKGPFMKQKLALSGDWSDLKFNNEGSAILVSTNSSCIYMLDAFSGILKQSFDGYANQFNIPIEACWSPNDKFVFCGSSDAFIHIWDAHTGFKIGVLQGHHPSTITCLKFNPKFMMMTSACQNVAFWLPEIRGKEENATPSP